jgi:hypothetical protein
MKLRNFYGFLLAMLLVPAVFSAETSAIISEPLPATPPAGGTQDRMMIMPPIDQTQPNFLGQDHYYSVNFRGNGEAVVSMKALFSNLGSSEQSTLTFTSPKIKPEEIVAYQIQREGQCIQYEPQTITDLKTMPLTPKCISYQEPDYSIDYFYGKTTYLKAEVAGTGGTITVTLPKPVEVNKSGSIIVYYRGMGYASKNVFGAYNYAFETLKTKDNIRRVQVGINTDSDMVLKNSQGNVNYAPMMESSKLMTTRAADAGVSSAQFDTFYQQIGSGMIIKDAANLKPDESYTVTGSYAKSNWQLYGKEIAMAIIIPLLLILLVGIPVVRALKRMKTTTSVFSGRNILLILGVSFLTAVLLGAHTGFVVFLSSLTQSAYYYQAPLVLSLLLFLIAGSIYLLILVVPSIVMGAKRGLWVGVMTAVATIIWIIIGSVLIGSVLLMVGRNTNYPVPMMRAEPMMMNSVEGSAPPDAGMGAGTRDITTEDIQQVELK